MNRVDTIKLTVKSLLEVVQTGAKNIEITVMESFGKQTVRIIWPSVAFRTSDALWQSLSLQEIETIVSDIEREKEQGKSSACMGRHIIDVHSFHRCRTEEESTGSHDWRTSFHVVEGTGSTRTVLVVIGCTDSLDLCNNLNIVSIRLATPIWTTVPSDTTKRKNKATLHTPAS